ncbi:hypothetical protein QFZ87_000212 [Bacillus sp. SLBN-46]|uniref:hypothetical protein n=1 Tax=Bacillus sp. SLBN-46 TaxID=3042283 RepID=UPI002856D501|nr:hypothetical protein [Bacillus sp. SLBN-46]MDR6120615.1 hypothetical protein [Bacillus sp. SLBN-46]
MSKLTLDEQIKKQQQEVWELAELCDSEKMNNRDRIFEKGLVMEETEVLLNMFRHDSEEVKKDYLLVLNEMRKFYKKISKSQNGGN